MKLFYGFSSLMVAMALSTASVFAGGSLERSAPVQTVDHVDLSRYLGNWYEIASFPLIWQRGCTGTMAHYSLLKSGHVRVYNTCYLNGPKGRFKSAKGKAFVVDPVTQAKLKVQFFWPFKGDYWILALGDQYEYALVGSPNRKYLWILSRTPQLSPEIYDALLQKATEQGFNVNRLNKTLQWEQE